MKLHTPEMKSLPEIKNNRKKNDADVFVYVYKFENFIVHLIFT